MTKNANLLVELQVEELPPRALKRRGRPANIKHQGKKR